MLVEITDYLSKATKQPEAKEEAQIKQIDPYGDENDNIEDMYGDEYGDEFGDIDAYGLDLNDENLDSDALLQNSSK